jgi:acyl dehydratase
VVGTETEPLEFGFDWKTVVLYALGIGATRDELDFLYEGRGPKVLPTFGVVPAYRPILALLEQLGVALDGMVHGAQELRLHRPIPPDGVFSTVARIDGVYDLRRLGQVVATTRSEIDGALVCETRWTLLFRDEGGFGGRPPPRQAALRPADDQAPSWTEEQRTLPEQALLYRLSGDDNPLHADPEFAKLVGFEQGPILHGLATFGFIGRALVRHACGGDPALLRSLTAQFKKPVWPGETIRTVGYTVDDRVVCRVSVVERDEAVVSNCVAEIGPAPSA